MSDVLLIEYVADLLKDDARFYLGLLGDLEKEIEESKTRVSKAFDTSDKDLRDRVRAQAHKIKGSAQMTGFQRVFTDSFKLESNSKDESVTSEELKKNKESWSVACQDVTEFKNDLTNLIGEDVKKNGRDRF